MKKKFLNGIISGGLGFFIKTLAMLLLTPQMIGLLGVQLYGAYLLFVSLSELSMLAASGMTTGFIQNFSQALSIKDNAHCRSLLITARWVYSLIAIVALFSGLVLLPVSITHLFHTSSNSFPAMLWVGQLVLIIVAVNITSQYFSAILSAHFMLKQINVIETIRGVSEAGAAVLILYAGSDLAGIFMGRLIIALLSTIVLGLYAWRIEPGLRDTWYQIGCSLSGMKELFSVSLFAMITKISVFIAHRMDEFVIAAFLTLADVTCFGLVMRMIGQIAALMIKLSEGVFPFFARLSSQNALESSRYLFLRSSALMHYLVCLLLILVMGGFPEFLNYMGNGKVSLNQAFPIALIACGTIWTGSIQIPASSYLFSSGLYRFQTFSTVLTAMCNLGLSIILIQWLGLPGVILGTLIPHSIQNHLITINMSIRKLQLTWMQFIKQVYLQTLTPLALALCLITIVRLTGKHLYKTPLLPLTYLIVGLFLSALVSTCCWMYCCMDSREKDLLRGLLVNMPCLGQFMAKTEITVRY